MKSTNDTIKQVGNNFSDVTKRLKYLETQSTPKLIVRSQETDPQTGINGQIYINKLNGKAKIYVNGVWIPFADTSDVIASINYLPVIVNHLYTSTSHVINWTYQEPSKVKQYHIYRNDIPEIGNAEFMVTTAGTSASIPYRYGDEYVTFGIIAEGIAGDFSDIVWSDLYYQVPWQPQASQVNLTNEGFVVSWETVSNAKSYDIEWADDVNGANNALVWSGTQTTSPPLLTSTKPYFRVHGIGFDGSSGTWTNWTTDSNPPPTPSINVTVGTGIVTVSLSAGDTSSKSIGFSHYVLQKADDGSGTNMTVIDSLVTVAKLPYVVSQSQSAIKFYRLVPYDLAGNQGGPSAWTIGTVATPGVPIWITHLYNKDGHYMTWYIDLIDTINTYTIYRNTSASLTGATVVSSTIPGTSTNYLIPYGVGNYFGIKAVARNGAESAVVWTILYDTTPPTPTGFTVEMNNIGGFITKWSGSNIAELYEVESSTVNTSSLTTGLTAFWNMNETSGNRLDSSGGGYTLVNNNSVGYAAGKISNSSSFVKADSQYLSYNGLSRSIPFTISGWFYTPVGSGSVQTIVSHAGNFAITTNSGSVYFTIYYSGGVTKQISRTITDNAWHHFIAWCDSSNMYLVVNNGTAASTTTGVTLDAGSGVFQVGNLNGSSLYFTGQIDMLGTWNRVLTSDERTLLYSLGGGTEYPFTNNTSYLAWSGNTLVTPPLYKAGGYKYFRVRAKGYDGSYSSYTSWATDGNAPPVPTINKITEDNNQVSIFISPSDTSHTAIGFKHYTIQKANDGSGTGATTVATNVNYSAVIQFPISTTGILKYYRISATDYADNTSSYTAWTASSYFNADASVKDYFNTYGSGASFDALALSNYSWKYLILDRFETNTWTTLSGPTPTLDSVNFIEGTKGLKLSPSGSHTQVAIYKNTWTGGSPSNFVANGTFTSEDFFTFAYYVSNAASIDTVQLSFSSGVGGANGTFIWQKNSGFVTGWNYATIKRSSMTTTGSPVWTSIDQMRLLVVGVNPAYVTFDDLRISKADPDTNTIYNETGGAWKYTKLGPDSATGDWHIYRGNTTNEPSKGFSFGQSNRHPQNNNMYMAYANKNIVGGTVQSGLYIQQDSNDDTNHIAGISFMMTDTTPGNWTGYVFYYKSLDPNGVSFLSDTFTLVRYNNGTATTLNEIEYNWTQQRQMFWLGVDLREYKQASPIIKIYFSKLEGGLINSNNIFISYTDSQYLGNTGYAGLISNESVIRFFDFTAGSPAHAEVADVSKTVDGPMVDGRDDSKRVFFSAASRELMYSTDRVTWQYSRNHFNWATVLDDFVSGTDYCSYDPALWAGWQTDSGFSVPVTVTSRHSLLSPYWVSGSNPMAFLRANWTVPGVPSYSAFPFRAVVPGFVGANTAGSYSGLYLDDYNGSVRTNWIAYVLRYNTGPVMELVRINNGTATVMKTFNDWFGDFVLFWTSFSSAWSSWTMSLYFSTHGLFQVPTGSTITGLTWTPTRAGLICAVNGTANSGTIFTFDFIGNP